jgi:uncharacterized OB-fold protein
MADKRHTGPLPIAQPESEFYWQKAKERELWLRQCRECGTIYFYPRDICPACFSRSTTWIRSSGRGTLYSFSIVHRAPAPIFRDGVPYVVAIVELEGGARLPTNLVGIEPDPAKIRVGMAVEVVFEEVADGFVLPRFRPIAA